MAPPIVDRLATARLVPVIRAASADEAIGIGRELVAGGMTVIEATFTTPDAAAVIRALAQLPGISVGAGSIRTRDEALEALDAGADFLVAPTLSPWLLAAAQEWGVVAIPGCATPTEIVTAVELGAPVVKVFPIARLGGADYIRDLRGPLPNLPLMATGGADVALAIELLRAGCLAVGVGSVHSTPALGATIAERAATALAAVH